MSARLRLRWAWARTRARRNRGRSGRLGLIIRSLGGSGFWFFEKYAVSAVDFDLRVSASGGLVPLASLPALCGADF